VLIIDAETGLLSHRSTLECVSPNSGIFFPNLFGASSVRITLYFSSVLTTHFLLYSFSSFSSSCVDLRKPSRFKISALTRQMLIYVLKKFLHLRRHLLFIRQYLRRNPIFRTSLPFYHHQPPLSEHLRSLYRDSNICLRT